MIDFSKQQLGRLPSKHDRRTLQLAKYVRLANVLIPPDCRWDKPVKEWGALGNDLAGNCVVATAGHEIHAWETNVNPTAPRISDADALKLSRKMGAMNGYNILDRNVYWRKNKMWDRALWAFAAVDPPNHDLMKVAVAEFGSADIGINLPAAWRGRHTWDSGKGPSYRPNTWGPHSVPLVGYDANGLFAVSWGDIYKLTWSALDEYADECYALISPQWLALAGKTPAGYDLVQLHRDLHAATAD